MKLAAILRQDEQAGLRQILSVVWNLSIPAFLAQITVIAMQYIDTAMVGSLGANASAAIGVVSTSTWLLNGLCNAVSTGFSVQVAEKIGAGEERKARTILKHALVTATVFAVILMLAGVWISGKLPVWLGADREIWKDASDYFLVFALSLPILQLSGLTGAILQCSGNMKTPAILDSVMCLLDVVFNFLFIHYFGVLGAALGTALAELVICLIKLWFTCMKSPVLRLRRKEPAVFDRRILQKMLRIGVPMGFERLAVCGAMIASTRIIAPLGTIAMAANSIAVTAESICYMPGYGIASAATTLVGQSIGAGKERLTKNFANLSVLLGCLVMTVAGIVMYVICPVIFRMLTPDLQVQQLAIKALRIELFAEPLYAASIVASGALRGAGDTLIPSILNLISIWGVRLTLSCLLVNEWGLPGVWFAMCMELCVRGILMLGRQYFRLCRPTGKKQD
jgi:putative MATE family efflux protein